MTSPRRPRAGRVLALVTFASALMIATWGADAADASVFLNASRWPTIPGNVTKIAVCIEPTSSTSQRGDGASRGLIHDRNPNLQEVVARVRAVLGETWERWSSARFVDWRMCDALSASERQAAVGVWIHPDAPNNSFVGTIARGRTTNFKPWGNSFNRCISYNWRTTHVEYRYDCVEQYAIHEFGHVLGFDHEWRHPQVPAGCPERAPLPATEIASTYPSTASWTVVNTQYDWDSIMTYVGGCADQDGVRFGSPRPSQADVIAVSMIYPPIPSLAEDVCNPGWFEAKRWRCTSDPFVAVGNSCGGAWVPCIPGCNPGVFADDTWTCRGQPHLLVGESCSTGWRRCGF